MLLCTVRDCRLKLTLEERRLVCPRGHSFDVARSGYVNLLQPQDKRSKHPGDTQAAVTGRRRIHDRGVTQPLLQAIREDAGITPADVVLDAGCGEGFYLGSLLPSSGGHGVDISIAAIDAAARRYPGCEWVVANADRFIPYEDASFSLILSITARMNVAEFARVGRPGARALIALPAPDDLVELRGRGREDRVERTIADFEASFRFAGQRRVTTTADLDADTVRDILHSIYRPIGAGSATAMRVTFSLDLLLFMKDNT
jgi:23S rRNA (guanine745-N1)-methyltransferase